MENWDLQAIVGGSSNNITYISDMENQPFKSLDPWSFQLEDDYLMCFPDIFETKPKVFDELEELYKPFYPELNPYSTTQTITRSIPVPPEHGDETENHKGQQSVSDHASSDSAATIKPKRSRRNQKNKVVQHVTANDLPSDIWAWRKYGQKPIKGSPYPRSYYRCSSSKGCLARKQVERSSSDPQTFIITYTAEHSHGQPTRRNSLAGTTRKKSSSSSTTIINKSLANKNLEPHVPTDAVFSPTAIKDEEISIKMEEPETFDQDGDHDLQRDKILTPHIMLSSTDKSYESLENFEDVFLDQFPDLSHELWSMLNESALQQP